MEVALCRCQAVVEVEVPALELTPQQALGDMVAQAGLMEAMEVPDLLEIQAQAGAAALAEVRDL